MDERIQRKNAENLFRGSGNYSSEEAKEIVRFKKELKDTQDALEILKKAIGILGKQINNMFMKVFDL